MEEQSILLVNGAHGIYVPQVFAQMYPKWKGEEEADEENWDILLAGPDHPEYDEAWDAVLFTATYTDEEGDVWQLWQDGDLWAYTGDGDQWT